MSTTSVLDVSEIFGRDIDRDVMLSQLLTDGNTTYFCLRVLAIVGMAGMGKTTLARLVYNEFEVQSHFDKKIWVSVPYPFNEMRTAKAILSRCVEEGVPNLSSLDMESIVQQIKKSVLGKKVFLVLDDVWVGENEVWEPLINAIKYGSQGSRILLTTRNEEVAQILGATFVYRLGKMADEHCLSLFNQIAHFGRSMEEKEHLEEISIGLVNKCDGLPLAVKFLGSLMRLKNTEKQRQDVLNSELWQLKGVDTGLFGSILLSYHDLPSELKPCLSLCSIFSPRDETIKKEQLISLWIAQGYVSSRGDTDIDVLGEEYFDQLVMRSFIFKDVTKDRWVMHDIVHKFIRCQSKDECCIIEVGKKSFYGKDRLHVTVIAGSEDSFSDILYKNREMRTLLVKLKLGTNIVIPMHKLLDSFKCLRALGLANCQIDQLPGEIEKSIHLRYLDLSHNSELKNLPEAVCNLVNLQYFNLSYCRKLRYLPKGMPKLINLRHLLIYATEIKSTPEVNSRCTVHFGGNTTKDFNNQVTQVPGTLRILGDNDDDTVSANG